MGAQEALSYAMGQRLKPKLIAYGTFNVYDIGGKAYYLDHIGNEFLRAQERDFMIKKKKTPSVKKYSSSEQAVKDGYVTGLMGVENEHLTIKGLIAKMREWDETEHGVEAYVYDITKRQLESMGHRMPNDIRRLEE